MRKRMFVSGDTQVDHVWMNGADLDRDLDGIRCRLEIGREGGVICSDMVSDQRLNATAISAVATTMTIVVERSVIKGGKPVRMHTDDGRHAVLIAGDPPEWDRGALIEKLYDERIMEEAWPDRLDWRLSTDIPAPRERLPILIAVTLGAILVMIFATQAFGIAGFVVVLVVACLPIASWLKWHRYHSNMVAYEDMLQRREDERRESIASVLARKGKSR